MEDELGRLAALAYGAALDDRKWERFLQDCAGIMGGGIRTCLFGYDADSRIDLGARQHGYDPRFERSYAAYYAEKDVLAAKMLAERTGEVTPYSALWSDAERRRSEFYNDWVRPQEDITGGCSVLLFQDERRLFAFSGSIRARDAERLERPWQRMVATLTPHLRQAFEIARTLAAAELEKHALVNVSDPATAACLAITRDGQIVFANPQADRMLDAGAAIRCDFQRRLVFAPPGWHRRFAAALRRSSAASPPEPQTLHLSSDESGLALICRIAPLAADKLDYRPSGLLFDCAEPCLLVTLSRRREDSDLPSRLRRRFGLTPQETEIVQQVAAGLSARAIAEGRGTSVHTVRNQIQSALGKMQVHRQIDIVRLVEGMRRGH